MVATNAPRIKILREQKQAELDSAKALTDLAEKENRTLTSEEASAFDNHLANAENFQAEIERHQKLSGLSNSEKIPAQVAQPIVGEVHPLHNRLNFEIPREHYWRLGALKSFKGPNADKLAYGFGRFALAALMKHPGSIQWLSDSMGISISEQKKLNQVTNIDTKGGVLVPDEFAQTIIDLREVYGRFRQNVTPMPMGSGTLNVPRRTGGITTYWVSEGGTITASDAAWDNVKLVLKKLAGLIKYSSEISEDALISLGDYLASEIAYGFAYAEDLAGFIGDGTSTYGGVNGVVNKINDGNHTASIYTAATGNTAFSTLDLDDFIGVVGQLPEYAHMNAMWYISLPGFSNSMQRLAYGLGGNTVEHAMMGMQKTFLGYPVVISQVLNKTLTAQTSTIVAFFGDLKAAALMGEGRGLSIAVSDQRYFEEDNLAIRGTERVDINIHSLGDTSTAGPIVALKTAAS